MRLVMFFILFLSVYSCSVNKGKENKQLSASDSIKKMATEQNNMTMLQPLPADLLFQGSYKQSEMETIFQKCAVFVLYSDNELNEMKKSYSDTSAWNELKNSFMNTPIAISQSTLPHSHFVVSNVSNLYEFVFTFIFVATVFFLYRYLFA